MLPYYQSDYTARRSVKKNSTVSHKAGTNFTKKKINYLDLAWRFLDSWVFVLKEFFVPPKKRSAIL
jgi:hypothetical protein